MPTEVPDPADVHIYDDEDSIVDEGLAAELQALEDGGRLRRRPLIDSANDRTVVWCDDRGGNGAGARHQLINWASNDYLGFANHRKVKNGAARALRSYGAGAGAARLLAGGLRCHRRLEQRLAHWLGREDALLTTTGFQANLATLVALASSNEDAIIIDRLCHASSYDGARLAPGGIIRFAHNDVADLRKRLRLADRARRRLVCVESIYSMDGDRAPLAEIAAACAEVDALLLVDEAHALGVYGPGGRGCCAELGVVPEVLIGTCSKALGSQGGFIAGSAAVVELCVNRGRSFIFSTAPVPAAVGAALASLDLLRGDEQGDEQGDGPDRGQHLRRRARGLRQALTAQGWEVPAGDAPIVPLIVGTEAATLALAERLRELGHYAPPIRPPTVPPGRCRLRLTVTAAHKDSDLRRLIAALASCR